MALPLLLALRALAAESLEAEWRDSASEMIFPALMQPRVRAPDMVARFITVRSGVGRTRAGGLRDGGGGDLGLRGG